MKSRGITVVQGEGRLASANSVTVDGTTYTASKAVILATGSYARTLPGLEIDGGRVITSDQALTLDYVPRSAVVLGGGVIGVEFASVWKSFGVDVTIVEALPHLVPLEDEANCKLLERAFRKRGIAFKLGARFSGVEHTATRRRREPRERHPDRGRPPAGRRRPRPASAGLGYEEAGVGMERGFVLVDEFCRTNVPGVYAVGDLIPTLQLAHVGFGEGILVAEHIAGLNPRADRLRRRPAHRLLRPRGRLRRHHRGQRQGAVRRRTRFVR